jgi:uncharacterized protein YgbK (DUF1537 family)
MTLQELLKDKPPTRKDVISRADIRRNLEATGTKLVVVHDDPTGTQTVHGIRVYMDWTLETMRRALSRNEPVFYISTNSRALSQQEMRTLSIEVGKNLKTAAAGKNLRILIASRSDSTLRGHYPAEVDALAEGLDFSADGVILSPALFEAGRYTINDIHWVDQAGQLVKAGETEFARDPVFGYRNSNLKEWVEEKTGGRWKAKDVLSLSLDAIRGEGPEGVLEILMQAQGGAPIILNAVCYEDLEAAILAIMEAEKRGERFVYRCAACFVKVRGGFIDRPLLSASELGIGKGPGLIIVGSYVEKTSRQLNSLLASGESEAIELQVDQLAMGSDVGLREVERVVHRVDSLLNQGKTVAVYTSRTVRQAEGKEFLDFGNRVMTALCNVVKFLHTRPNFVVAKGGISSIEIARKGLGVKEAYVPGQIAKGVPLWQLGPETKWPEMLYIVFPGNVGDDDTLRIVVEAVKGKDR